PFDPAFDYGNALADVRHIFKLYGSYDLPLPKGNKLTSGWYTSFIFIARTGLPIPVTQGGDIFGSPAIFGSTTESAPTSGGEALNGGVHSGVAGSGGVGTTANPAAGGTGLNLFANPEAAFNSFRPFLLSVDGRTQRGVARGLGFWNLDFSIGKATSLTERANLTFV